MLNNHVYNLLIQATEEHKSLWRIKDEYIKDADGCAECINFWQKLEQEKAKHVGELEVMLKNHIK